MGEWMSVLEMESPLIRKMIVRKARMRGNQCGQGQCSEIVQCMKGDVANLADIEGVDFKVVNADLIEYIRGTF